MHVNRLYAVRVLVAALALMPALARAQSAEAEVTFERGRRLMTEGKTAEACAAFDASMRLDSTSGTLYNLGLCHEKLGKLASAWTELSRVAKTDSNRQRATDAEKRAAALEPRLVRMRLIVDNGADGLVVERNGVDVTALAGEPVPVDPGQYTFIARAPGRTPTQTIVDLTREGATVDVRLTLAPATSTATTVTVPSAQPEYPAVLPLRPLVLPAGHGETTAAGTIATDDSFEQTPIDLALAGRYSLGRIELRGGVGVHVRHAAVTTPRPGRLSTISLAGVYSATPTIAATLEYATFSPFDDVGKGSDLRAAIMRKVLVSPDFSIESHGGFAYVKRTPDPTMASRSELTLQGAVFAQTTALRTLSFEAASMFTFNLDGELYSHTFSLGFRFLALYPLSPKVDLYASVLAILLPAPPMTTSEDYRALTIGVNLRPQ